MIQRLSLFLFALVLTMPAWAQGGSGNESETITIASKEDWKAFCDRVNKGQTTLNAKLTQDVDLGSDIVMAGREHPYNYNSFYYYTGTFDGQGHTLSFSWDAGSRNDIAPFKYVKDATIKNLRTQGKITSKRYSLSGMVRAALGTTTISGCISDVDITGGDSGLASSLAAGMVQAVADGASVTITDCLVKGSITDNADESDRAMAGFVFSNSGTYTLTRCLYVGKNNAPNNGYSYTFGETGGISATFTDCYYLNTCGKAQGEQVTAERLKSGEMAKLLQGDRTENVWGQTLGTDLEPLPTTDATKRVYQVKFTYNGEVKATRYATNGQSIHGGLPTFTAKDLLGTGYNPKLTYTLNFGNFTATTPVTEDKSVDVTVAVSGTFPIATAADWKEFCALVNGGQNAIDAKMTADVDLGEDIAKVGTANKPYAGTFDGQNHVLTVNWDAGSANDVAPFRRVGGATIKNLRTEGSIRSNSFYLSGLIDEAIGENTVTGCVSNVNLTISYDKSSCGAAGLICCLFESARVTISDCLVKGSINATAEKGQKGMGGFVFIQHGSCIMNNCLYAGTNNASGGYTFASDSDPKATTTLNNCYYLNPCGKLQGEPVTKAQLKNGYVAHKLQGTREETVWGQVLGTDTVPLLTDKIEKRVYEVKFTLNNEVKATRYANNGQGIHGTLPTAEELLGAGYNPKLTYALNFGDFTATTPVTSDKTVDVTVTGPFDIATAADWKSFCQRVKNGEYGLNAKLTADVDLGTDIVMLGYVFPYKGTFDGQGHTLTLNWDAGEKRDIAPFRSVDGATIRNLRVKGQITTQKLRLAGLVAEAFGTTTITGCATDVRLTGGYGSKGSDAAGLVQWVGHDGRVTITDCLVKGTFTDNSNEGDRSMAGFVFYNGGTSTLTNCLYLGTNNAENNGNSYTFADNGATFNNCYYLNACGRPQGMPVTAEQLKNGEVAKKLQNNRTDKCYWAQQLGEMPDFYNAADKSKANYVYYDAAKKGWACDDFRLTDEQPLPIGLDFTAANVTYERNFNGTQKATLCLPYDLSAQGFKAYTLSGGNKNEVHFKETKDKLTAYTPYYITADGTPLLGGTNIEVKAYTGANLTTSANGYSIKGTVVSMDNATAAAANAYILQDDGMFHKVTTDNPGAPVPAYHAYIICPPQASGAKQLSVVLDGETTGIGDVTNEAADGKNGPVYDLQGRRVADRLDDATRNSLPAGIYIVGGRKVVVK